MNPAVKVRPSVQSPTRPSGLERSSALALVVQSIRQDVRKRAAAFVRSWETPGGAE